MNKDIRLSTSFLNHRKRKKLQRALGAEGVLAFIDLMLSAAMNKPGGVLVDMDREDIALDAQWDGDPDKLVEALIKIRLLEVDGNGTYSIHDWHEHNEYAAHAKDRSEKAKKAARARWEKRRGQKGGSQDDAPSNATSTNEHCNKHDEALQGVKSSNAPSPSPSPSPNNDFTNVKSADPATNPEPDPTPQAPSEPPGGGSFKKPKHPKKPRAKPNGRHFSGKAGDFLEPIKTSCKKILKLPPKGGARFNPYQWVQKQINQQKHPGAVNDSLSGLVALWGEIQHPWPYADKIIATKNGNWNEREAITESQQFKHLMIGDPELKGLLKAVGAHL